MLQKANELSDHEGVLYLKKCTCLIQWSSKMLISEDLTGNSPWKHMLQGKSRKGNIIDDEIYKMETLQEQDTWPAIQKYKSID